MTEQLAAKELEIDPKEYIMRESCRSKSRTASFMAPNNNQETKLQFDSSLVLPEESKIGDTEYAQFFDAVEKLTRTSYKKNPSGSHSSGNIDETLKSLDEYGEPLERDELPWLKDPANKISIWAIIKDCMGKDLSKVSVPVYINDPTSSL